jgi:hypothetical protein
MKQKFAVLNPSTGLYDEFSSSDLAVSAAVQVAFDFFIAHTHGQPFAVIEVDDTGKETWTTPAGESILSPAQLLASTEEMRKRIHSFLGAETMPTTTIG